MVLALVVLVFYVCFLIFPINFPLSYSVPFDTPFPYRDGTQDWVVQCVVRYL